MKKRVRNARSRSRALARLPATPAVAVAVEQPSLELVVRTLFARQDYMLEEIAALRAEVAVKAPVLPDTMIDTAKALTVKQACHILNNCDDNVLYRRKHLLHFIAGTYYLDNDEIRADFPGLYREDRWQKLVEKRAAHEAAPLDSRKVGNDIR